MTEKGEQSLQNYVEIAENARLCKNVSMYRKITKK